jgi:hypothetical protein
MPVEAISQPTALRSSDRRKPWLATPMTVAIVPVAQHVSAVHRKSIRFHLTYFRHLEVANGIKS